MPTLEAPTRPGTQAITVGNWRAAFTSHARHTPAGTPDSNRAATAQLARILEQAYRAYRRAGSGAAAMAGHWRQMQREDAPPLPAVDARTIIGRRQPGLAEAVPATLARYAAVEALPGLLDGADAVIVGGSMSYGPFFNVRGGGYGTASDIDVIVVGGPGFPGRPIRVGAGQTLLDRADVDLFTARQEVFTGLYRAGAADVLSQRFGVPGQTFDVSVHVFSRAKFAELTAVPGWDGLVLFNDFRAAPFKHPACFLQGFDGARRTFPVPPQEPADGGVIARIPGFEVVDGRMYAGLYLHLVSPEFAVFADRSGWTSARVAGLRRAMVRRLAVEASPGASLAGCHIRRPVFAPGRYPVAVQRVPERLEHGYTIEKEQS